MSMWKRPDYLSTEYHNRQQKGLDGYVHTDPFDNDDPDNTEDTLGYRAPSGYTHVQPYPMPYGQSTVEYPKRISPGLIGMIVLIAIALIAIVLVSVYAPVLAVGLVIAVKVIASLAVIVASGVIIRIVKHEGTCR